MKHLLELIRYRQMLFSLISTELRTRYKGSFLGFIWTYLNPLFLLLVYTIIFKTVMKVTTPHYAMFLFVGLLPWNAFQACVVSSAGVVIRNAGLVKKIYFPRDILPLSVVGTNIANYLLSLVILFPCLYLFGIHLSSYVLYFPILLVIQAVLMMGFAFLFSSINVYFRDVEHILGIVTMAWFYLTPIIYQTSMIPGRYLPYFHLNPMAGIIEGYQNILFWGMRPNLYLLGYDLIFSVVLFTLGWALYQKLNKGFAEEI